MSIETTKAVYVIKLIEVLADLGLPTDSVARAAGLSSPLAPEQDLPISDYLAAVEIAVRDNPQVPDLGFRVGAATTFLEQGVLGYALLSSPTLRDCLRRYVRYQYLQGPLLSIGLEDFGETAAMVAVPRGGRWPMSPDAHRYMVQEWLIGWNDLGELVHRKGGLFEHVRLGYPAVSQQGYYEDYLRCTVSFDNDRTAALFPARRLDLPLEYADESIAALCKVQCERLLEVMNLRSGLVAEIHRQLSATPGSVPGMPEIAGRLHVGARTLRRQLKAEGTTYQDVVRDFRIAMAKRYLEETTLPVSEVAALVGYSDPANLYRCFRDRTGLTPREYRDRPADFG